MSSLQERLESLVEKARKAEAANQRAVAEKEAVEKRAAKLRKKIRDEFDLEPRELMAKVEADEERLAREIAEIEGLVNDAVATDDIDI